MNTYETRNKMLKKFKTIRKKLKTKENKRKEKFLPEILTTNSNNLPQTKL